MNIPLINIRKLNYEPRAHLTLDIDQSAERILVNDRNSGNCIYQFVVKSRVVSILLDERFSVSDDLFIIMVDDSKQYNAVILDFIKLNRVDSKDVLVSI